MKGLSEIVERVGELADAFGRAGDRLHLAPAHEEPDGLGRGDGDDGQVVHAEAQRGHAEDQRQDDRVDDAEGHTEREVPLEVGHRDTESVGAGGHEADLAEVQQAGIAELHVQTHRSEGEHQHLDTEHVRHGAFEDESPVHQPILSRSAEDAVWPEEQDQRHDQDSATMFLTSASIRSVDRLMTRPTTSAPTRAP